MSEYNRQPVAPVIMVAAGVVLILGAVFWSMSLGQASQVNNGIGAAATQPPAASSGMDSPVTTPRIPYPDVPRISVADAKAALDAGQAVFIDTRGEPYFSSGHIPGAISMTSDEVLARLGELDPNDWIITYCTWPAEESSARVAQMLIEKGFKKVNPIQGGLESWVAAGYPTEGSN